MNIDFFLKVKKSHKLSNVDLDENINEIIKIIKSKKNIHFFKKFKPINVTNLKLLKNKDQNEGLIIGILNKLSNNNYDKLKIEILNICDSNNMYDYCINSIFNTALIQHTFTELYVNLLHEIQKKYNKTNIFVEKKCLEFKKITTNNNSKDSSKLEYEEFCENNKKKNVKIGYSQFIGQLLLKDIIEYDLVISILINFTEELKDILSADKIQNEFIEDYIICIDKLFTTILSKIKNQHMNIISKNIDSIINNKNIIKRLKFKLMDLKDKVK